MQGKDITPFLDYNFDKNLENHLCSTRLGKLITSDYWFFGVAATLHKKVWRNLGSISEITIIFLEAHGKPAVFAQRLQKAISSCQLPSATSWFHTRQAPSWGRYSCDLHLRSRSTKGSSLNSASLWPLSLSLAARRSRALWRGLKHQLGSMTSTASSFRLGSAKSLGGPVGERFSSMVRLCWRFEQFVGGGLQRASSLLSTSLTSCSLPQTDIAHLNKPHFGKELP